MAKKPQNTTTPALLAQPPGPPAMQPSIPPVVARAPEQELGRVGPINELKIKEAEGILKKYKEGKYQLDQRIVENELWFRMLHWELIRKAKANKGDPEPASAWLLNCIANKHADAMDNFPQANVLPRELQDKPDAEQLASILPVVLQQNRYEQVYSDTWWYKLKSGTGVKKFTWNKRKFNGLGDVDIIKRDILNLFWQPGVTDIQASRNFFDVDMMDQDQVVQKWPFMKDHVGGTTFQLAKYVYEENVDTSDKIPVIDWYYKVSTPEGRELLHYCKFCNGIVIYASENDPTYAKEGFYHHGKYPYRFDVLFPEEGSPCGFGYVDVIKSPQIYIDKLDQAILKSAINGARRRYWVRGDGIVNEEEYADYSKDFIHFNGSGRPEESIFPIEVPPVGATYENIRQNKIDELKETSGNRDFSQGGTASGVTAASAIAALQEAGSKLSRDMIKSAYRAFIDECYLVIEIMRQFYDEERYFRITNKMGEMDFVAFSNANIAAKPQGNDYGVDTQSRMPIFDIEVKAQKQSPFSTAAENERAKEFYSAGFFDPARSDQALACLEMMTFEGIDNVRNRISKNGTMFQKLQQIIPLAMAMAQQLDALRGTQYTPQVAQVLGIQLPQPGAGAAGGGEGPKKEVQNNSIGEPMNEGINSTAGKARQRTASATIPK